VEQCAKKKKNLPRDDDELRGNRSGQVSLLAVTSLAPALHGRGFFWITRPQGKLGNNNNNNNNKSAESVLVHSPQYY